MYTPKAKDGMPGHEVRKILTLQDFEVLYVRIFGVDIKLDSGHGYVEEDAIVDLAESSAEK